MGTEVLSKFMVPAGTSVQDSNVIAHNIYSCPMFITVELLVPDTPPITEADLAYVPEGWNPDD